MASRQNRKKDSTLNSLVGGAPVPKSDSKPASPLGEKSYARKPGSNIVRRKTTLKKIEKVVSESKAKRARKETEQGPSPVTPVSVPAVSPSEMLGGESAAANSVAHKFDIPAHQQPAHTARFEDIGDLPESYNSGTLFLTARDPHWLYSYWDYARHKMNEFRSWSADHCVRLRVYKGEGDRAQLQQDIILNPDAQNWFIHVGQSRQKYHAELGYYTHGGFHVIGRSVTVSTPADDLSPNTQAKFATLPFHIKFQGLVGFVKAHFRPGDELMDVLYRLQVRGFRLPFDYERPEAWGEEQEAALLQLFGEDLFRRIQMGSFEISEWLRQRLGQESLGGVNLSSPSSPFGASWSLGEARGFWFNVNAEIILYGETDPRAKVCVDGKQIRLRPDGSFRFHFALPDGKFKLPITAESVDHEEVRSAVIDFSRATEVEGDVGKMKAKEELPEPIKG